MHYLSNDVKRYSHMTGEVLSYFERKGYTPDRVAEYGTMSGIPLAVVYYVLFKNGNTDALEHSKRLCEFYQVEFDLEG